MTMASVVRLQPTTALNLHSAEGAVVSHEATTSAGCKLPQIKI